MLSLGCIQARSCNTDECPTGIATQNPARNKGLVVKDKASRVAQFQEDTVANAAELIAAAGLDSLDELMPIHINRRVQGTVVKTYAELYPNITGSCLLAADTIPAAWRADWEKADAHTW